MDTSHAEGARQKQYIEFPEISYRSFSYEGDQQALENIKRIPGVSRLFKWIIENMLDDYLSLKNKYYRTRVDENSYPSVLRLVERCAKILDCPMPDVYITYDVYYNAHTNGISQTYISLNSAVLDEYSEEELMFIIGHEMGHIKAGHVLYLSLGDFIVRNISLLNAIAPVNIGVLYIPLLAAMYEWRRRAEFTCDRAGLLTVQDPEVAMNSLSRFSGKLKVREDEFNIDALVNQVHDVKDTNSPVGKALLFMDSMLATHPYPVLRLDKLREWINSGGYAKVLKGDYIRDETGEHELGKRIRCDECSEMVNYKLDNCPHCGASLWGD